MRRRRRAFPTTSVTQVARVRLGKAGGLAGSVDVVAAPITIIEATFPAATDVCSPPESVSWFGEASATSARRCCDWNCKLRSPRMP